MRLMGKRSLCVVPVVVALVGGCDDAMRGPDIAGRVARITEDAGPELLVVLDEEHPDFGDDARVSLGMIEQPPAVAVGDHVRVWLAPVMQTSDPPGVSATRIDVGGS